MRKHHSENLNPNTILFVLYCLFALAALLILATAHAQTEELSPLLNAASTPPAADAVPINPLENPVVNLVVALTIVLGLPGTIYLTALFLDWLKDANIVPTRLTKRTLGLVAGIITAGLAQLLGALNQPALEQYPIWLRVVGLGLVFGLYAGGRISADQQAQKKAIKLADDAYSDANLRVESTKDYA